MTMGLDVADARTRRAVEASRSEASASMTSADEDDRIGRARSVTRPRVDDDDDDAFGASRVFERLARASRNGDEGDGTDWAILSALRRGVESG